MFVARNIDICQDICSMRSRFSRTYCHGGPVQTALDNGWVPRPCNCLYCYCGYCCCYHIFIILMFVSPDLPNPILAQHQHPQVDQGLQAGYVVQPEIIHIVSLEVKMSSRCSQGVLMVYSRCTQGVLCGPAWNNSSLHHFDSSRSKMFSTCCGRGRGRRVGWSFPSCGSAWWSCAGNCERDFDYLGSRLKLW